MRERELPRKPEPDILTKQFDKSIHPYTMMFLYLAYSERAHLFLKDDLQRQLFDLYFTGNLTIAGQEKKTGKINLEKEIREGFATLRQNASDRLNQFFNENRLPFFKIGDIPFVSESDIELKKHKFSNQSMRMMGNKLSEEHKRNIGIKMKGRKFSKETRAKFRQAKLGTKQSAEVVANRIANVKKKWAEDKAFRIRMKIISDSRKKVKRQDLE